MLAHHQCPAGLIGDMKDFVALRSFVQPYFARFEDAEGNAFLGGPDNEEQYHYSAAFRQVLAEHFWRLCRAFYALRQSHTRQFHLAGSKKEAKVTPRFVTFAVVIILFAEESGTVCPRCPEEH